MKKIQLMIIASLLLLFSCRNGTGKKESSPEELMSVRSLGLAYLEEFRFEEAEKEFTKFIKLAPGDKFGYANLGLTYLRAGKLPEAEKQLLKATEVDPGDPDILLILATVYRMTDRQDKAVEKLKEALSKDPAHVKALYELSEIYSSVDSPEMIASRKTCLEKLIQASPANMVPRLDLTELLLRSGMNDPALAQLEIIRKQFPEFPKEAIEFYKKTLSSLHRNDKDDALLNFTIFHNYMKVTSPYQAGMADLKGPGGQVIGFPLITFGNKGLPAPAGEQVLTMKFTETAATAGLDISNSIAGYNSLSHIESIDFDMDGDIDIYMSFFNPETSASGHFLFSNNSGRFTDITISAGLKHTGTEVASAFGDYDNDGFPDLFIIRKEGDILYRNTGKGTFEDVSRTARLGSKGQGTIALFFDADHDGDLDLFEGTSGTNLLFRNNSDGTFTEQSEKMQLTGSSSLATDAAFADFDEDGDIDLFVAEKNGCNALMSNQRQSVYRDIAEESGLKDDGGSLTVAAADYNNDGFQDLFIGKENGENILYKNLGNGKFEPDDNSGIKCSADIADAEFTDYDNDGFSDLILAGKNTTAGGRGILLLHNEGNGRFTAASGLLPAEPVSGNSLTICDYNEDGDEDIAVAKHDGSITLLRNDGGNNNHYVKMKLFGLRAGSAKNNYFGIGAKVELRAGDLYQSVVVTSPEFLLGIGQRPAADVIRITWSNGVPQNVFLPAANQSLIEAQTLKGSCPFLYVWNGSEYAFVKDILWRSGLGMPLGIMGGTTAWAFADASDDYLKIPGETLCPLNGKYSIQVTSELWETIYLDRLQLVAVDHPATTDIYVEEQFSPPPFPGLKIFHVKNKIRPVSAVDSEGNDLLKSVLQHDYVYSSNILSAEYQGITETHDIIVDPGKTGNNLIMFLTGWIFPSDASINVALSQSSRTKVVPPFVQVMNSKGEWQTVIDNISFPMGKDKTVIADLTGKFLSEDHRMLIRTNMEIYWDEIFFSAGMSNEALVTTEMEPVSSDLHYRGFSEMFRKGGRYGPHWFDYSRLSTGPKWRDLTGRYTRYGDVLPLLTSIDNKYIIYNAGDEATIQFDAGKLPLLKKGYKRDFLVRTVGWVKDGDINTAFGNTVLPLPFHGMKSYPPSASDQYPDNQELQQYNNEYNTRIVTSSAYLNALKIPITNQGSLK
jgi:thioredoxin-like negative regulator of GroEL